MSEKQTPLTAIVEFQIRTENTSMEEWLDVWADRGDDARNGEPETTAYEALRSREHPDRVLIFERYATGEQGLQTHIERPAHAALTEVMGARKMTKRRVMSALLPDVDLGWWSRPEVDTTLRKPGLPLVVGGLRFQDEEARAKFLELCSVFADYCAENEPDTLVYSMGLAEQDSERGPDIQRGDLVYVMACTDDAAANKHAQDPKHLALGTDAAALGIQLELTFQAHYETTGKGFLWKPGPRTSVTPG